MAQEFPTREQYVLQICKILLLIALSFRRSGPTSKKTQDKSKRCKFHNKQCELEQMEIKSKNRCKNQREEEEDSTCLARSSFIPTVCPTSPFSGKETIARPQCLLRKQTPCARHVGWGISHLIPQSTSIHRLPDLPASMILISM